MSKLILKNGTEIALQDGSALSDTRVLSETKEEMIAVWDLMTNDNLKEVEIRNEDGEVVAQYVDLILDSETSRVADGGIMTSFNLREKTDIEKLQEKIEELENGQQIQDGAIADLGEAVSELM